jgi:REP element-mobilizing transposase RayT
VPSGAASGSLGAIIGNLKSMVARRINQIRDTPGAPVWQRNYYEHVIRTERALRAIREYIALNPTRWRMDRYNVLASEHDPMAAELWRLLEQETR